MTTTKRAAAPIMQWPGGKRQLLPVIREMLPARFNRYHEPFMGGGAVFFDLFNQGRLQASRHGAFLADSNVELMDCYGAVRRSSDEIQEWLHKWPTSKDHFLEVRSWWPRDLSPEKRAARTIYLNRTCFNGLYRVNRRGEFSTAHGTPKPGTLMLRRELERASGAFSHARFMVGDFRTAMGWVEGGDFVYCDPPFLPVNPSGFTAYTPGGWTAQDQDDLHLLLKRLRRKGALIMLSAPGHNQIVAMGLEKNWKVREVRARRAINSDPDKRGKVAELIITNY